MTFANAIKDICQQRNIPRESFRWLDRHRGHKVLQDVTRKFLTRVDVEDWWQHARGELVSRIVDDGTRYLEYLCNTDKKVWFILCCETTVYETRPDTVSAIVRNLPVGCDYMVADKKLEWFVIENKDHKLFVPIGDMADRLAMI